MWKLLEGGAALHSVSYLCFLPNISPRRYFPTKYVPCPGYNGAPRGRRNCVDMGLCTREAMRVPRGERYELCRSVHAEANAIISAARRDMVGGTLYLVGRNAQTGELLHDATSCAMCRRLVINAGLSKVVIRNTETEYSVVDVQDWVDLEDDVPDLR